jgi:hypothetical protein
VFLRPLDRLALRPGRLVRILDLMLGLLLRRVQWVLYVLYYFLFFFGRFPLCESCESCMIVRLNLFFGCHLEFKCENGRRE